MANLGITQILSLLPQISHLLKQYNPQRHAEKEMSFWIISTTTHQCYPKAYLSSRVFMWQIASQRVRTNLRLGAGPVLAGIKRNT